MPIYVFECPVCLKQQELTMSLKEKEENILVCTGSESRHETVTMETVIQATGFSLKGPRWARDGYGGK